MGGGRNWGNWGLEQSAQVGVKVSCWGCGRGGGCELEQSAWVEDAGAGLLGEMWFGDTERDSGMFLETFASRSRIDD